MWARRLILVSAALIASKALADDMSAGAFVFVAKREISGKTGNPVKSVELRQDGSVSLKDGADVTIATVTVSAADLDEFRKLLSDPAVLASTPHCQLKAADLPQTEFAVGYGDRILTIRVPADCPLPAQVERLNTLLDAAERTYLPGG